MRFFLGLLALAALPLSLSLAIPDEHLHDCQNPTLLSQVLIGENDDVEVKAWQCANTLERRQAAPPVNVCGATCMFLFIDYDRIVS